MIRKDLNVKVDIGANPSAEGAEGEEEAADEGSVSVNAVADAHRLAQTSFDKKSYTAYIRAYMKALLGKINENNPSRAADFQKGAQEFVKKVISEFDEYEFWQGESVRFLC
jgi:hypothetical protein